MFVAARVYSRERIDAIGPIDIGVCTLTPSRRRVGTVAFIRVSRLLFDKTKNRRQCTGATSGSRGVFITDMPRVHLNNDEKCIYTAYERFLSDTNGPLKTSLLPRRQNKIAPIKAIGDSGETRTRHFYDPLHISN